MTIHYDRPAMNGHAPTVYDVSQPAMNPWLIAPPAFGRAYCAWLCAHGIDPGLTYRTEHHLIDVPLVRVFAYDIDEDGRRYADEDGRDAARQPYDVLAKTKPPKPEDYA